jgi:hypothetical protein
MKLFHEEALVQSGDEPLLKILKLWHDLCKEVVGHDFAVNVGNRREHSQLAGYNGEFNVAIPHIIDGKAKLIIWVDNTKDVKLTILTHEISHWILKLQGFQGIVYQSKPHIDIEVYLNTFLHHPGVYEIQRKYGHDPKDYIKERIEHYIKLFQDGVEGKSKEDRVQRALLIIDDYLHSSEVLRGELDKILREKHKLTKKVLAKIIKVVKKYNLVVARDVKQCGLEILKTLGFNTKLWKYIDEINTLKNLVVNK